MTVTSGWHGTDFWTGFTGRVSKDMLNVFVPDIFEREIYMCGPEPFANSVKKILYEIGYDISHYHSESFSPGRSAQDPSAGGEYLDLKGIQHKVTFTKSGLTVNTDENISLLTLAEAHGIHLDYSCRAGSCGECEAKCKGQVAMSPTCEIDEKTKAAGFVYTCCCTAKSDLELEA